MGWLTIKYFTFLDLLKIIFLYLFVLNCKVSLKVLLSLLTYFFLILPFVDMLHINNDKKLKK